MVVDDVREKRMAWGKADLMRVMVVRMEGAVVRTTTEKMGRMVVRMEGVVVKYSDCSCRE
jgi:hypothetical protein